MVKYWKFHCEHLVKIHWEKHVTKKRFQVHFNVYTLNDHERIWTTRGCGSFARNVDINNEICFHFKYTFYLALNLDDNYIYTLYIIFISFTFYIEIWTKKTDKRYFVDRQSEFRKFEKFGMFSVKWTIKKWFDARHILTIAWYQTNLLYIIVETKRLRQHLVQPKTPTQAAYSVSIM